MSFLHYKIRRKRPWQQKAQTLLSRWFCFTIHQDLLFYSNIIQALLTPPPHPQGAENGEAPAEGAGGFMGGIMGKANALKAKAAETAAAAGAGNLQVSRDHSLESWKIFRLQSTS